MKEEIKEMPDWNDNSRDRFDWELELEEHGDLHNNPNCQCNWEEPDGCDCDMGGLKSLFWKYIQQQHKKDIEKIHELLVFMTKQGDMIRKSDVLNILKDK